MKIPTFVPEQTIARKERNTHNIFVHHMLLRVLIDAAPSCTRRTVGAILLTDFLSWHYLTPLNYKNSNRDKVDHLE